MQTKGECVRACVRACVRVCVCIQVIYYNFEVGIPDNVWSKEAPIR